MRLIYVLTFANFLLHFAGAQHPFLVFTKEDLEHHAAPLIYVCGNVFGPTNAKKLTGFGCSEKYLHVRNATRNITDEGKGLTSQQCAAADRWLRLMHEDGDFVHLGVLSGHFYDTTGEETEGYEQFRKCVSLGNSTEMIHADSETENRSEEDLSECDRSVRDVDKFHIVSCKWGRTPRKSYFTVGHSVGIDGDSRSIRINLCTCLELDKIMERQDLELFEESCDPQGTECAFDNHENDIHH